MTSGTSHQWLAAEFIVAQLQAHGFEGYLIGGAVRDILLNRDPKDFDVVTNATPEQVKAIPSFKKTSFTDPAQAFGVTRITIPLQAQGLQRDGGEEVVEVATYRKDVEAHLGRKLTKVEFSHIEDDLERRDFTINALALDPHNSFLVDLHEGLQDLEAGTIRFIGDPQQRIAEDPLRILRAVRFRNQLGFSYDPATKTALAEAVTADQLSDIAIDRIFQELSSMLIHKSRRSAIEDMDSLGILDTLLPEVVACKGVQQPKDEHSEGDVWTHTMLALDGLPEKPSLRLAWATLLHDVGKTPTYEPPDDDSDRIHFDNHFRVGADMARDIFKRLKASKALTEDVAWLVHYHLITDSFPDMKQSRRYHYMSNPAFHDLLALHEADLRGSIAADPARENDDEIIAELKASWEEYKKLSTQKVPSIKEDLGVDGHWLINEYGISDGEVLGALLKQLQEDYLDGLVQTVDDAKEIVEKYKKGQQDA